MEYLLSTISDVVYEADSGRVTYTDRAAPLAVAHGLGLELAEFCITENMDGSFAAVAPRVERCAAAVARRTLHAPYNELFPMAIDPKIAAVAYERLHQAWRHCLRFGADKLIVHANYVEELYFPSWFVDRHVEFWRRFLGEHGEDVTVCVENVMERTPEYLLEILCRVDEVRLRLCLDVGHANLSDLPPMAWLEACAGHIDHYHLHNNDGPVKTGRRSMGDRHAALDDGSIDMYALLRRAEELTPRATAAVESYEPERCVRWLAEKGFI